jgi:hypothetical protein
LLWKGFHLFSYDKKQAKVYSDKVPWIMHLEDGCPIQVRTNDESPYMIDFIDGDFVIKEGEEIIARNVWFERKPRWYDMKTEDGVQMGSIVQGIARMMFVTMNKVCEHWNGGYQCLFCDFNETTKAQKKGGEDIVGRLSPEAVANAVKTAMNADGHYSWLYLSGGTFLSNYQGKTEVEWYCERLNAIRDKLQVWIPATFQVGALDDEGWKRIHDTGVGSVQPNIEVWGKELFEWICPGKARVVGFDEWIKRTVRAVDFWGPNRVTPNFVLGVEMAKPHGFKDVASAVKSTAGGWDFLMKNGVLPRYATWVIEANSTFGKQKQTVPPLEYFIEVQKAYAELRWKYKLDTPFPGGQNFTSMHHCTMCDFEYYHGTGCWSKKYLDARLGVPEGAKGGHFDQEGYLV